MRAAQDVGDDLGHKVRRRMLARSLAAGVGLGVLARLGVRPAEAANGDSVTAGQPVSTTNVTTIQGSVGGNPSLRVTNGFADAVDTKADGIQGFAAGGSGDYNAGVFGRNNVQNGIGMSGAAPNGTGAYGESLTGSGVAGKSSSGRASTG